MTVSELFLVLFIYERMWKKLRTVHYQTDLCVIGGGLAGLCCAIAAARHGIRVVLVHDRPVLGGNASSEIRMAIGGAHGKDHRESGMVEEFILENFYQNPSLKYPLWDMVLYEKAKILIERAYNEN